MQTIIHLTFATIRSDEEAMELQAIKFWSMLAEEEIEIMKMAAKLAKVEQAPPPIRVCMVYVKAVLEHLTSLLIETLKNQDEEVKIDNNQ